MSKPTTTLVPVTLADLNEFGTITLKVEHLDGTVKLFTEDEGNHDRAWADANEYRMANLVQPPIDEPCSEDCSCSNCCQHYEHDHGICLDCGEDRTEDLAADAEYAFEGDR